MAASSAGHEQGKSNRENAGNSNRIEDTFLVAAEHDYSVNGSQIDSWPEMDCNEGRDEKNEGDMRGRMNENKVVKGNKRIRKDNGETFESEEEVHEQVQRERPEKCIVIIRFNEKAQENMKRINLFVLPTALR